MRHPPHCFYKLYLCALVFAVWGSNTALAEPADQDTEFTETIEVPADTIIVSARRREENIQDVPMSVSVVSGKTVETLKLYSPTDLQQLMPSTTIMSMSNRLTSFAIRGLGNGPVNEGLDTSVGLYLDNVYLGRPGMAMMPMIDLEQVEELRGPQGTLFGKNTTAGLISFNTRKPVFSNEISASVDVGSRAYLVAQGVANQVVSESAAIRLTAYATHDNGWLTNEFNGKSLDGNNSAGVRGQVLVVPSTDLNLRLIADYYQQHSSVGTPVPYSNNGPGSTYYTRATAAGATGLVTNPTNYQVNINSPQLLTVREGGVSAELNARLAGDFMLTSITAGRIWNSLPQSDPDLSNVSLIYNQGYNTNSNQFSQEFKLTSPKGGFADWVAGLYFYNQTVRINSFANTGPNYTAFYLGSNALPYTNAFSNVSSSAYSSGTTNSYAAYGQSVFHLNEHLDLTAGLRGTIEQKWAQNYRTAPSGGTVVTQQTTVLGAWNAGTMTYNNVSPTALLNLAYRLTPQALSYISYSYGEKSGGFNLNGVSTGPLLGASSLSVNPERTNDFELGLKSNWLDQRLLTNVNLFLTQVNGYQTASTMIPNGSTLPVWQLVNAGGVRSQGVELEFSGRPTGNMMWRLNGSYNDVYYTSFQNGLCGAGATPSASGSCDLTGQPVNGAPKWITNLGGEYKHPLQDRLETYIAGNYAWRSWVYGDVSNSIYSVIPSYGLLDLTTGLRQPHGNQRWDLAVWARNLTNTQNWQMAYQQTIMNTNNPYVAAAGMPRTIGITLKLSLQ